MPPSMEDATQSFGDLIRRLSSIRERGARVFLLAENLAHMDAERAACFLDWICREFRTRRQAQFTLIYNAFVDLRLFPQRLEEEKRCGIKAAAREMGFAEVANLLEESQTPMTSDRDTAPPRHPSFKGLTLGERKAAARGTRMRWIEQLLHDQNPSVIRNLLANPRITEREVLKIASKTPTAPVVLEEVARSPRWISRYMVKKALILNPHTPVGVALALLDMILMQDLQAIWKSRHLAPSLRERARRLCNERREGTEADLQPTD